MCAPVRAGSWKGVQRRRAHPASAVCSDPGGRPRRGVWHAASVAVRAVLCLLMLIPAVPDRLGRIEYRGLLQEPGARGASLESFIPFRPRSRTLLTHAAQRVLRLRAVLPKATGRDAATASEQAPSTLTAGRVQHLRTTGDRPNPSLLLPHLRC
ncbi:hypothetical protein [Aquisphaera giovannonii]|uniref:hypothetical protein n=1 Tax=Aquisphaera giovannonii TaxID=406548 RepID=UPI0011E0064A|nr:hypothetical protein [Aquisphaera giovannonii]